MQTNAREMKEMTACSQQVVGDLAATFGRFALAARETERQAAEVHDKSFATLVKLDHMIYKQRTYLSLNSDGDCEHGAPVAVGHEECRLGRWYRGDGKALFGQLPAYGKLEAPHAADLLVGAHHLRKRRLEGPASHRHYGGHVNRAHFGIPALNHNHPVRLPRPHILHPLLR